MRRETVVCLGAWRSSEFCMSGASGVLLCAFGNNDHSRVRGGYLPPGAEKGGQPTAFGGKKIQKLQTQHLSMTTGWDLILDQKPLKPLVLSWKNPRSFFGTDLWAYSKWINLLKGPYH